MSGVVALSCALCYNVKCMGVGCEDELAAGGYARGRQGEGRGGSHAHEGGAGSLHGEWTKDGPPCGAIGAGASWLGESRQRVVFRAERVGQGRVG